ncbi:type IV pilus biogenesis/stability protein PilW [Pseudoalteromonas sp. MMG010]|uniref:type IV pilus biogenesis/stability protein PilW n=1 Tax=Pseudoalteromonas sp. MMG010 TaxID=2822685 RepID=UPI001B39D214|nr:type IV pilus biogenesis/stability protein PilW [Pseudoalteromonas sp. MMG010]MBQ4833531.1 type IV pilus biogenesis/stability protein PilW [Pseudoalteromonas sp. MMG010]
MRSLLVLTMGVLTLTGCVTETSYKGSDKPVPDSTINNESVARTRISLALQYLAAGNNSQAKYNLERAMEFAPHSPEVHYSLAYYYQQVGEDTLADKSYQKALSIKPDDPNTLNNYGVFLCSIDKYDEATDQFLKAIAIPSYIRVAESYENLALCAIEFDDFDAAQSYFIQAMNHSSQRSSTVISLAALYYAKSDLHKANELIVQYENKGLVSPRFLLLKYLIKQRTGHLEAAEKIALTIQQTYPSSNEAVLLREQALRKSEFEILRNNYRKASLKAMQEDTAYTQNKTPKIIIKRKKRPVSNNSTSLVAANIAAENTVKTDPVNTALTTTESITTTPSNTGKATTPVENSLDAQITRVNNESASTVQPTKNNSTPAANTLLNSQQSDSTPSTAVNTDIEPSAETLQPSTDTTAVLSAIMASAPPTSVATPKVTPQSVEIEKMIKMPSAETTQQNSVKIISFGSPTTTNINKATTTPNTSVSAPSENEESVVFYRATKDTTVFANDNKAEQENMFNNSQTSTDKSMAMLNPKVSPLTIPFHIIQFGENLFSISVRYNVKLQKLLQWNGLKESDRVVNGSKIYLNDPNVYYEIKTGDTLYDIATQQQVLIDQLMRWNKLSPDIELTPGHRLLLVDPDSYKL